MGACLVAWGLELRNLARDYIAPALRGERSFIADFQFFYEGAQRFLTDPLLLYRVNTRDGFLLIEWNRRVDYGYPPPAVLLFVPFALVSLPLSYAVFTLGNILLVPVCVWLMVLLREWERPREMAPPGFGWLSLAFAWASGMTYVTLAFGQVNVWVLLICLLYMACVMDGRYVSAGVLVGLGFWLKFYPIFLLALAPFEKRPFRLLAAGALGVLLVPAALQAVLPLELYAEYFRDIYPGLAGQTSPHIYNQSVVAWLTRFLLPGPMILDWGPVVVEPGIRILSGILMVLGVGGVAASYRKCRQAVFFHYAAMLAVVPMVVTYGWGGTYLLALPLILLELGAWFHGYPWAGWLAGALVMAAYIVSAYKPFGGDWPGGDIAAHLFHNRYLYLTLLILLAGIWRRHKVDADFVSIARKSEIEKATT